MEKNGREWDTRAWLVGILGGVIGGSVTAWATYPPLVRLINASMHQASAADWISGIAAVLSLLVLPGVVSGLARRRPFLWGLLSLTLFLIGVEMEDGVENGTSHLAQNFWPALLVVGIGLLVSSGPVSLIRYQRVRSLKRQEAAHAAFLAQREAASIPQEGVWPPPDYRR